MTHFKDVFRSLADEQDGIHYWKEETLCRFLAVPDALGPGPVLFQMVRLLSHVQSVSGGLISAYRLRILELSHSPVLRHVY